MKYFSIFTPDPRTNPARQPTAAESERMNRFMGEAIARGEFVSGGMFLPLGTHGSIVRRVHGNSSVVDGPYIESRELIGGFAMLQYESREAAIEGARRFLEVAGDGECVTYAITEG